MPTDHTDNLLIDSPFEHLAACSRGLSEDRCWLPTRELAVGMYVHELEIPWQQTPFSYQGFFVDDCRQIEVMQQHSARALVSLAGVDRRRLGSGPSGRPRWRLISR